MTIWCPKCAKEVSHDPDDPSDSPCCKNCGFVVDKIYRCHCGAREEFRAVDNVPQYAHYCAGHANALAGEVREHLVPVVARWTAVTGPFTPA